VPRKVIDISVPLEATWRPTRGYGEDQYLDHRAAPTFSNFSGLKKTCPTASWGFEMVRLSTHCTAISMRQHSPQRWIAASARPARRELDFGISPTAMSRPLETSAELKRIGHTLSPLESSS
jgi:hypothetical protein